MENIGRYTILGEIGRGAMGVVYRAQDTVIGRIVAIKTIRLADVMDPAERERLRERLFREAQSAGILSHPNIITIYDVAEEGANAYVAMEYVDGPTLDALMVRDPPDSRLVLHLLAQTAAALDYAHKRGIVHRDIKPANIIIENRDTAKIADFGVAKVQSQQMTHAGTLVGTPNYMSPEQIQGEEVTGKSDQFSLAVIAYEMLTGDKPFAGDSLPTLIFKVVRENPVPVHRLNATLGWPVDAVLQRGLAKRAADRFPTCADFIFALDNACRTSKDWHPIAPGSTQNTATVVEARPLPPLPLQPKPVQAEVYHDAPTAPLYASAKKVRQASLEAHPPPKAPEPVRAGQPPKLLRFARWLALIILAGGMVAALLIGALRYFGGDDEPDTVPEKAAVRTPATPSAQKPGKTADSRRSPVEDISPPSVSAPKATPQAPSTGTASQGKLSPSRFVTNPAGVNIIVDGKPDLSCRTPCSLELTIGRHTVLASLDGYRRTLRVLDVPGDDQVFLSLEQTTGTLMIRTEPPGATVSLNGEARPEKTPAVIKLPVGKYTVEVSREEKRESEIVEIKDGTITNVGINFP